ncbi:MAG: M48 family metallopeptidase [Desulfobacterales bacterium]
MKYTPRQPKTNVNVTPTSPLRELLVLTVGLAAILVGLYFLLGLAVDVIVPRLSTGLETKLGAMVTRSLEAPADESRHQRWVQDLTDRIQARCARLPYLFRIHIRPGSDVNALAFPGGHIVVYQGLLDAVVSENELAFVLAHEMGHYAHRDHLRGLGRAVVFMALAAILLGPDSSAADFLVNTLGLAELSFSRQQEGAADQFGLKALNCLYGHVGGSTDFFAKIPEARDPGKWGHYFTTHPANARRILDLKAQARQKGYVAGPLLALPGFWQSQSGL